MTCGGVGRSGTFNRGLSRNLNEVPMLFVRARRFVNGLMPKRWQTSARIDSWLKVV